MSETLRIGSLFSGYGGLDQGIQQAMGGTVTWVADIDPGPRKILAHRYPHAPNLGDVTTVDWATVAPVDLICGGSPCQDLSMAGRRAGMRPGGRSGLWESMREAIAVIRPEWVVWENVRGALSAEAHSDMVDDEGRVGGGAGQPVLRALGRVLGDLADLGYDSEWRGLRAADVGAPHGRYRIFVVARAADADGAGLQGHQGPQGAAPAGRHGHSQPGAGGPAVTLLPTPRATDGTKGGPNQRGSSGDLMLPSAVCQLLPTPRSTRGGSTTEVGYILGGERTDDGRPQGDIVIDSPSWGDYAAAIARWEAITRPAPSPTEPGHNGPRLSPRFTEWLMGLPDGWITDVPGITRTEALRMCGNGVVPQQAVAAVRDCLTAFKEAA